MFKNNNDIFQMNRFNSIAPNRNLRLIERHDNICDIEPMLFVKLDIWDGLINQFERVKGLGQQTQLERYLLN